MTSEIYQYIFYCSLILCGIMFVLSVVFFFVWKIPKAIGMVTGSAEKKYIKNMKSNNTKIPNNQKSVQKPSQIPSRKIANEYVKSTDVEYTADEMTGEFAESSYTDSIATLTDMEDDSVLQEHSVFKILYEITYIHTNERI